MTRAAVCQPMLIGMRIGPATWRRLCWSVLPVAFVAALPLVQWCSLGAEQVRHCPMAASAAQRSASACATGMPACGDRGAREGQCPFDAATGRTFCVGPAMGGPGVRPLAPGLQARVGLVAILPCAADAVAPPVFHSRLESREEARPPTRSAARKPPTRAPPAA